MADIIQLPVRCDYKHYDFSMALDDKSFLFEFRWNDRDGGWYMTITAIEDGAILLASRKVTVDWPLTSLVRDTRMFRGELFAIDTSGQGLDPQTDDFGQRVLLAYFPPEELPEVLKL